MPQAAAVREPPPLLDDGRETPTATASGEAEPVAPNVVKRACDLILEEAGRSVGESCAQQLVVQSPASLICESAEDCMAASQATDRPAVVISQPQSCIDDCDGGYASQPDQRVVMRRSDLISDDAGSNWQPDDGPERPTQVLRRTGSAIIE